jgi:hypothetical protein
MYAVFCSVDTVLDETDAKPENSSEKVENGGPAENGVKPPTTTSTSGTSDTNSTSGTSDTIYELPQEKLEKPGKFV